jgi:hypothetical protein
MFVLREKATNRMRFSRSQSPARNVLASPSALHRNRVVILSGARRFLRLPRIGLRTVRIAMRSLRIPPGKEFRAPVPVRCRSGHFVSPMLLREIPLPSHRGSYAPILLPRRKSSRICTYKIAELTPLESALVKKERGQWPARARMILNFRLSTVNYQLATTPLECVLTRKGGGGPIPHISTLTLDLKHVRGRSAGMLSRARAASTPLEPVRLAPPLDPVRLAPPLERACPEPRRVRPVSPEPVRQAPCGPAR